MSKEAINTLKFRLAKGEISLDEYNELMSVLTSDDSNSELDRGTHERQDTNIQTDNTSNEIESKVREKHSFVKENKNVFEIEKELPNWAYSVILLAGFIGFILVFLWFDSFSSSLLFGIIAFHVVGILVGVLITQFLGIPLSRLSNTDVNLRVRNISLYCTKRKFLEIAGADSSENLDSHFIIDIFETEEEKKLAQDSYNSNLSIFEYANRFYRACEQRVDKDEMFEAMYLKLWVIFVNFDLEKNASNVEELYEIFKKLPLEFGYEDLFIKAILTFSEKISHDLQTSVLEDVIKKSC